MPTRKQKRKRGRGAGKAPAFVYLSFLFVFAALATAMIAARALDSARMPPAAVAGTVPDPDAAASPVRPDADSGAPLPGVPGPIGPPATRPAAAIAVPGPGNTPAAPLHRGTLVFVIDDAGHNITQLQAFLDFPGPLTIAVLPGLPWTAEAARLVREAGKELILHQPMEAVGSLDAGPGAITTGMEEAQIRRLVRENLYLVPGAVGMNNHMGSRATADVRVMSVVLDEARRAGVYFLDSLTIGDSVVHSVASLMKLPAWERTVFLDNTPDRASIIKFVTEGTKVAEKRGYAVMIGHVWSAELAQTLADLYPQLMEQGFSLSTISRIMMESDDEDSGD